MSPIIEMPPTNSLFASNLFVEQKNTRKKPQAKNNENNERSWIEKTNAEQLLKLLGWKIARKIGVQNERFDYCSVRFARP
jgi:hypothetical protein